MMEIASSSSSSVPSTMKASQQKMHRQSLWIEKYRPKTLSDIAHQEHVVGALRKTLGTNNLPHLLFYGPPGTGKTSTILAVARELFGPTLMRKRVLELNASSDRGIKAIREKVKVFAKVAVGSKDNEKGYPCPPFKIIILDEADSMTKDAQTALRRTMEAHSNVTRFCIICNYVTKIIEPIASRCAKFRFAPLSVSSMTKKLKTICDSENVNIDEKSIPKLIEISGGDMRRCITLLQTSRNVAVHDEPITEDELIEIAGVIPASVSETLLDKCKTKQFSVFSGEAKKCIANGYAVLEMIPTLLKLIVADEDLSDIQKGEMSIVIADAERKLIDGADEWLQLLHVLSVIAKNCPGK